jgi:hypothetical protein
MQLFLELTTGAVPSPCIVAINFDSFHAATCTEAIVLWTRDEGEPRYFPLGTRDAQAICDWAATQPGEQFLTLPPFCFNVAAIRSTGVDDIGIVVHLTGFELPFYLPATSAAVEELHAWTGYDDNEVTARKPAIRKEVEAVR